MFRLNFLLEGDGSLHMSTKDHDVLHHLQKYVQEERNAPADLRVTEPSLSTMESLYGRLLAASDAVTTHERTRALARDDFKAIFTTLKRESNRAIAFLKARHLDRLQRLEDWGLAARGDLGEATVRKPKSEDEWVHFFDRYVEKEGGLPSAERVEGVHFGDFNRGVRELKRLDAEWRNAWELRQEAVNERGLLAKEAVFYLRWALLVLIMKRCDGVLHQRVERWGYRIIWPEGSAATTGEEGSGESEAEGGDG